MTFLVFLVVMLAAILHAVWNFAAKQAAGNLGALWLGVWLGAMLSWPCAVLAHQAEPLTLAGLPYIVATGILHAWYFGFLSRSYMTGDISLVYPVARGTGVAGTAVVAGLFLQERLSLAGVAGILAICLGTGLVGLSRHTHKEQLTAYVHALLVGVTITGYSIVDKLAMGHVHPVIYISGMFSLAALLLTPYVLRSHRAACLYAYLHLKTAIGLIGVGSICTYLLILFVLRLGPVSYIVAAREFAVVIGSILGFVILKEPLTARKGIGIAAITLGLILVKVA
jgi:drug/metabolite transporter (DMT)-like permease